MNDIFILCFQDKTGLYFSQSSFAAVDNGDDVPHVATKLRQENSGEVTDTDDDLEDPFTIVEPERRRAGLRRKRLAGARGDQRIPLQHSPAHVDFVTPRNQSSPYLFKPDFLLASQASQVTRSHNKSQQFIYKYTCIVQL
jgi:hypothetical protein